MVREMRIILANRSLATYLLGGGHWVYFLQYLLGLRALGHDILLLELMNTTGDPDRDSEMIRSFFKRLGEYGLDQNATVLLQNDKSEPSLETSAIHGMSRTELRQRIIGCELLWNFAYAMRQPLLSLFSRKVLIDGDPGELQVSALIYEMGQSEHDAFLSVGLKMQDADCEVPRLGKVWHPFQQFVYLPMWQADTKPPADAAFTSISHWNWAEVWLGDRVLSVSKRTAYFRYLDLPTRTRERFLLAANIHPQDNTGDRERLTDAGWQLVHPYDVACDPASYQQFIRASRGEFLCPKPIYRELKTGWFSDRSAAYLASGRPVLAEETGFSDHLPTGAGLHAFRDVEEVLIGLDRIQTRYKQQSIAARDFAETHLDSRVCLQKMLNASFS